MSSFKNTISYIKPVVMQYQWMFYGIFFLHAVRLILNAVITPIFYKRIIDVIANAGADKMLLSDSLFHNIFLIVALLPVAWSFGRAT